MVFLINEILVYFKIYDFYSFIEHAKALAIDPHGFRILCRNGSLADRNGFDVEPDCAIGNFVDGKDGFLFTSALKIE